MSYLLETVDDGIIDQLKYFGIYRDDGLAIFEGIKSATDINDWLKAFQLSVNQQTGNNLLQFTSEVWLPRQPQPKIGKTTILSDDHIPFLDMELFWGDDDELNFRVHIKPNQQIKYLNAGSSHTPNCFKAINKGVCYRLTKLMSITDSNKDTPLDNIYPDHFAALCEAGLVNKKSNPNSKRETRIE